MLVSATIGGALMTGVISVLMAAFALVRGFVDDLLLFPAIILSVTLFATTTVLSAPQSSVLVIVDFGAILIIAGMTLVYLNRLVEISASDAPHNVDEA